MVETPAAAQALVVHGEKLCEHVEHFWDFMGFLSIPTDYLVDTREQHKVTHETEPIARSTDPTALTVHSDALFHFQ